MTTSSKASANEQKIIAYGTRWCGMVGAVRAALEKAGAPYEFVDIRRDDAGRERVREINHGDESVPTLVFPDGSTLTEPPLAQLAAKLRTLGYKAPPP